MNGWKWVSIMLNVTMAFCGIYCLQVGEKYGCALMLATLMYYACRAEIRGVTE